MRELNEIIDGLSEQGFYGELLIKFEGGRVVLCHKTEKIKVKKGINNLALVQTKKQKNGSEGNF